jgi:transposase
MADTGRDKKRQTLQESHSLNPHPEMVTDLLFLEQDFFDADDLLQVKYEMLRRVTVDKWPVNRAARSFGFSRVTFYQARESFEAEGLSGLLPQKRGPRGRHKISSEVAAYLVALLDGEPSLPYRMLAERVREHFGLTVHPRSIERVMKEQGKKNGRNR